MILMKKGFVFIGAITVAWFSLDPRPLAAQETPQAAAPSLVAPPEPARLQAGVSVESAISEAVAAIDQLDSVTDDEQRREQLDAIEKRLTDIRTVASDSSWLLYLSGRVHAYRGRFSEAADQLRKFVETREGRNQWRAYKVLGDLFAETFPRLAKANYKKADALKPDEREVLVGLSACSMKLGYRDDALDFARRAASAGGTENLTAVTHLARVLLAAKYLEEARQQAIRALELAEQALHDRPGQRRAVADVVVQLELLVAVLNRRIEETPRDAALYLRLADATERKGRIETRLARFEALAIIRRGLKNTEPNPPAFLRERWAVLLAELDRREQAVASFQQLLRENPNHALARRWLEQLGVIDPDTAPHQQP